MSERILPILLVLFVLYAFARVVKEEHSCRYCGVFMGHEESCPFLLQTRDYDKKPK